MWGQLQASLISPSHSISKGGRSANGSQESSTLTTERTEMESASFFSEVWATPPSEAASLSGITPGSRGLDWYSLKEKPLPTYETPTAFYRRLLGFVPQTEHSPSSSSTTELAEKTLGGTAISITSSFPSKDAYESPTAIRASLPTASINYTGGRRSPATAFWTQRCSNEFHNGYHTESDWECNCGSGMNYCGYCGDCPRCIE